MFLVLLIFMPDDYFDKFKYIWPFNFNQSKEIV